MFALTHFPKKKGHENQAKLPETVIQLTFSKLKIQTPWPRKPIKSTGLWVYLSLTWCNNSWYRGALHVILNSNNTDVVLYSWTEVLQGAGVLPCLHKLLHTVSLLPISGSACYSVASDVWRMRVEKWKRSYTKIGKWVEETRKNRMIRCWEKKSKQKTSLLWHAIKMSQWEEYWVVWKTSERQCLWECSSQAEW